MTQSVKLAEALLRRKELNIKVNALTQIKGAQVFETITNRVKVADGIDEFTAKVPKLTASQVTHELDWHSRQLRRLDSAIQNCNWTTEIQLDPEVMGDYVAP